MAGKHWTIGAGLAALAGLAVSGGGGASAQEAEERGLFGNNAEATIYRSAGFNGSAVTVTRAEPRMGLAWRVQSIRVRSGRWELCEEPNYRGECWTVDRDTPIFGPAFKGREVQSMRPWGGSGGSGGSGSLEPGRNPSMRGMGSEFYPAPAQRGYRVPACSSAFNANAACAQRSANEFCAAMGWRMAVRQSMETVRRQVYLADVLCANTSY